MTKFHINPETGEPGTCTAQIQCKYGSVEHYATALEARVGFEEKMKNEGVIILTPMTKAGTPEDNFFNELETLREKDKTYDGFTWEQQEDGAWTVWSDTLGSDDEEGFSVTDTVSGLAEKHSLNYYEEEDGSISVWKE